MADGSTKMGRPSLYSPELAVTICEKISNGQSLRSVCSEPDMPALSAVIKWLTVHDDFAMHYAHAREAQADALFDEMLDIADDSRNDWIERLNKRTGEVDLVVNDEALQRSKLRIDARKWIVAKLLPKKYGERLAVTGADGGALQVEQRQTLDVRNLTPDQREQLRALIQAAAQPAISGPVTDAEFSEVEDEE